MQKYVCSAVVNDYYTEYTVEAVSDKQAWYKFCTVYGYRIRDFKIIGRQEIIAV